MILLADIGNSFLHWGLYRGGELTGIDAEAHNGRPIHELLDACWRGMDAPEAVIVANVAGDVCAAGLSAWVSAIWDMDVEFVRTEAKAHGVTNAYAQPEQLGVDRWVGLTHARHAFYGPSIVVDCGTAVTIDVLGADGQHRGGLILPGLRMMRQSLSKGTDAIAQAATSQDSPQALYATDTHTAITAGSLYAIAATVAQVCADTAEDCGQTPELVLTGGDAEFLSELVNTPHICDPDWLLRGLALIADNEP